MGDVDIIGKMRNDVERVGNLFNGRQNNVGPNWVNILGRKRDFNALPLPNMAS